MKIQLSWQIFEKYSSVKFNENPFGGTELFHLYSLTDGQTDTSQLMVTFREEKFNIFFDFETKNPVIKTLLNRIQVHLTDRFNNEKCWST